MALSGNGRTLVRRPVRAANRPKLEAPSSPVLFGVGPKVEKRHYHDLQAVIMP